MASLLLFLLCVAFRVVQGRQDTGHKAFTQTLSAGCQEMIFSLVNAAPLLEGARQQTEMVERMSIDLSSDCLENK